MVQRREAKKKTGKAASAGNSTGNRGRTTTVKHIRKVLGRTQAELAKALGISEKAVQSYEQGWRDVPVRVVIQLLVLLALYRKQTMDDIPCWEIRKCAPEQQQQCASFTVGRGQFCWFIGSQECRPDAKADSGDLLPCMSCPVIQRLLRGPTDSRKTHDTLKSARSA